MVLLNCGEPSATVESDIIFDEMSIHDADNNSNDALIPSNNASTSTFLFQIAPQNHNSNTNNADVAEDTSEPLNDSTETNTNTDNKQVIFLLFFK